MWAAGKSNIRSSERAQDLLLSTVLWGDSLISPVSVMRVWVWTLRTRWPPPSLLSSPFVLFSPYAILLAFPSSRLPYLPGMSVCALQCVGVWLDFVPVAKQTDACWHFLQQKEKKWESSPPPPPSLPLKDAVSYDWPCSTHTHTRAHTNNSFPHRNIRIHIVYLCTRLSSSLLADRTESNAAHPRQ